MITINELKLNSTRANIKRLLGSYMKYFNKDSSEYFKISRLWYRLNLKDGDFGTRKFKKESRWHIGFYGRVDDDTSTRPTAGFPYCKFEFYISRIDSPDDKILMDLQKLFLQLSGLKLERHLNKITSGNSTASLQLQVRIGSEEDLSKIIPVVKKVIDYMYKLDKIGIGKVKRL